MIIRILKKETISMLLYKVPKYIRYFLYFLNKFFSKAWIEVPSHNFKKKIVNIICTKYKISASPKYPNFSNANPLLLYALSLLESIFRALS